MNKIKIAALAVLLSIGLVNNASAQSKFPGIDGCYVQTMNWGCSVSLVPGAWVFNVSAGSTYSYAKVYLNGQLYGQTSARMFGIPTWVKGSWKVVGYSATGGCSKDLGTFTL